MSTQYPVLDNRPINKWKVAELKEELKRRKLTIKGLKEDLVKRLDEAIRNERGAFEEVANNSVGYKPELVIESEDAWSNRNYVEVAGDCQIHDINKTAKVDEFVAGVDIDDGPAGMEQGKVQEEDAIGGTDSVEMIVGEPVLGASVETRAGGTRDDDINKTVNVDEFVAGVDIDYGPAGMEQGKVQEEEAIGGTDSVEMIVGEPVLEPSVETRAGGNQDDDINKTVNVDEVVAGVDIDDGPAGMEQGKVQEEEAIGGRDSVEMIVGEPVLEPSVETRADDTWNHEINKTANADEVVAGVVTDDGHAEMDQGKYQEEEAIGGIDSVEMIGRGPVLKASVETNIKVNEIVAPTASSGKASEKNETNIENEDLNPLLPDSVMVGELTVLEASVETSGVVNDIVVTQTASSEKALENNEIKMENEGSKPLQMDAECDASDPNNQVYEVNPNLGFQVKSESISTDSVSVYEKNELKYNLNADNAHLELDVAKPEMVQPSSSKGPPNDGNLLPLDDNKPDRNHGFVEETDDNKSTPVEFSKKNDSADGGSLVVLKLDHNLADDSMGQDFLEIKPNDLNHNSIKVGDKIELIEMPIAKDGSPDDAVDPYLCPDKMETSAAKTAAAEEKGLQVDDNKSPYVDLSERIDMADEGPLEKINLDHSSADDYMEEDVLETKQIDSNHNSIEVAEKIELTEVPGVDVGDTVDVLGHDFSSDKLESFSKKNDSVAAPEKRKFQDEAAVGNKEPPKRQRRWNSESLKIPEAQSSDLSRSTAPKDMFQTTMLKHNLTGSDSTFNVDAPKERVVPPSPNPPTNSLRIDCFLRPFTLKAVQELLARTGNVSSFWMDQIKTHCYVTYSSAEEAVETRNALYNFQWPPNGGRLLVAEFVDPQEVKLRVEPPPQSPVTPVSTSPTVSATPAPIQPPLSTRQHGLKQRLLPQPSLPQPPPLSDPPTPREKLPLPPLPPLPEKADPPIVTLDDLFRKTRATPRIYYLPLTEEQVAAKLATQRRNKQ